MASFQTDQTELMNNHSTKVSSKKKWSHCQVLIICLIIGIIAVLLSNLDRVIESSQNESSSSSSIPEINCDYPQWLTPSTFYGDFIFGSGSGKLKFCFDGDNDRFAKHFMFEGGMRNISLIYNGHDYYWMCPGEEDCATPYPAGSCTYSYMPRIPFPSNQFENYSYIGREILYQRLISGEIIQVDSHHW